MSNIDQELNSQLSAWTIQCVIHHDESFVDPLCYLRRLNSGQPGERCLIPPIELVDVFHQSSSDFFVVNETLNLVCAWNGTQEAH